jgi:hypothetical protein
MKRRIAIAFVVMMLLCACAAGKTVISSNDQSTATDTQNASTMEGTMYTSTDGSLWVRILSPQDGDTFDDPAITVSGQAPLDTVLSIGDAILYTDTGTDFSYPLQLQEGANLIEIVASNSAGAELDIILTVYYEP